MPDRKEYIPGVPCWVDTSQPNPEASLDFYKGLFGWEFEQMMPPGSPGKYFMASIRGGEVAAVGTTSEGAPPMATWNTYISVANADDTAAKVRSAGGNVVMGPFDVFESGRMAVCADPEGAVFCVWQPKQHIGARVVNEHGALNFNGLNTRNVGQAKAFYGAVFGWTTISIGPAEMWTLPGYGDFLERDDPGLRKRVTDLGGPLGFEDVVASIMSIPSDQSNTPAHWNVTFGVDDARAAAAKAVELGGKVIVPPMDVPWSRLTVLSDPQGAIFNASQFVLENKNLG